MSKPHSILLDLLRFTAAMLVFLHHSEQILDAPFLSPLASFGHDAVIFFFILSGFVIGYVSTEKEKTSYDYFLARFTRIASVALPSIILVVVLFFLGNQIFPEYYSNEYPGVDWLSTIGFSALFLNHTALANVTVPTNGPYWSISYEVWYYIIFGVFFYFKGIKKWVFLFLSLFIAGLKIVALLPIWIAGYLCYQLYSKLRDSRILGCVLVVLSFSLYAILRIYNFDDAIFSYSALLLFGSEDIANTTLSYSKRFVSDNLIAMLFVMLLSGLFMLSGVYSGFLEKFEKVIRKSASYTFSIYLYHYPLIVFLSLLFSNSIIVMVVSLLAIVFIGYFTENKKQFYKNIISRKL